ncbi:hypothetical protein F5J12DRAFT_787278 [Pisolithus orientalis]|uniref:uncharacterized protein n=1 Tax=Pisolithus orientalis TaxID=936130 RepID=UPI002224EE4E|nr:uncharacterized protein F5J12DRAFT_787278 [Pisolithus orientalis]KAI5986086.1 hypothetical protein F5J12DRAFT_787278 [Pisolithus orientalis]
MATRAAKTGVKVSLEMRGMEALEGGEVARDYCTLSFENSHNLNKVSKHYTLQQTEVTLYDFVDKAIFNMSNELMRMHKCFVQMPWVPSIKEESPHTVPPHYSPILSTLFVILTAARMHNGGKFCSDHVDVLIQMGPDIDICNINEFRRMEEVCSLDDAKGDEAEHMGAALEMVDKFQQVLEVIQGIFGGRTGTRMSEFSKGHHQGSAQRLTT